MSHCTQCHEVGKKVSSAKCLECHKEIKELIDLNRGYHSSAEVKSKEIEANKDGASKEAITTKEAE
jgi:hypothetical protein